MRGRFLIVFAFGLIASCRPFGPTVAVEVRYPGQFNLVVYNIASGSATFIYGEDELRLMLDESFFLGESLDLAILTARKMSLGEFVDHGLLVLSANSMRDEAPMGDYVAELDVSLR